MELPYDRAVLFLYMAKRRNMYVGMKTSTQMFLAALLIIAQSGNDPDVHLSVKG